MPEIKTTNSTHLFTNKSTGQSTTANYTAEERGPSDLTFQIDQLKENKDALEGKIKFLQETCRRAGAKIKELETRLDEAEKWKHDEVEKFRNRLRDSAPYEKRLAND